MHGDVVRQRARPTWASAPSIHVASTSSFLAAATWSLAAIWPPFAWGRRPGGLSAAQVPGRNLRSTRVSPRPPREGAAVVLLFDATVDGELDGPAPQVHLIP